MSLKRQAIVNSNGTVYRDKQESLDFIDQCERMKIPIYGIEVVMLQSKSAETNMYKTTWYSSQLDIYYEARNFISGKMGGRWNYAEFKM